MAARAIGKSSAWLRAVEQFELVGKQPGKVNGPLGHVAVEVARDFAHHSDDAGCLSATTTELAERLARSRSAVTDALARLQKHGILKRWSTRSTSWQQFVPGDRSSS